MKSLYWLWSQCKAEVDEIEIDDDCGIILPEPEPKLAWLIEQEESIEVGVSSTVKRRKLEMTKLLDKLTIGNLDFVKEFDATDFVLKHERGMVAHFGKGY